MLIAIVALGATVAAMGCTMVGDNLTGVNLRETGPTTCVKQCNDLYKDLYEQEQKRHIAAIEACQASSGDARASCLEAEAATHEANKTALGEGKLECQNDCHRQGSGSAG